MQKGWVTFLCCIKDMNIPRDIRKLLYEFYCPSMCPINKCGIVYDNMYIHLKIYHDTTYGQLSKITTCKHEYGLRSNHCIIDERRVAVYLNVG